MTLREKGRRGNVENLLRWRVISLKFFEGDKKKLEKLLRDYYITYRKKYVVEDAMLNQLHKNRVIKTTERNKIIVPTNVQDKFKKVN